MRYTSNIATIFCGARSAKVSRPVSMQIGFAAWTQLVDATEAIRMALVKPRHRIRVASREIEQAFGQHEFGAVVKVSEAQLPSWRCKLFRTQALAHLPSFVP